MSFNLLLMSGDTRLTARLQAALDGECTLMTADPRAEEGQSLARRFDPDGVMLEFAAWTREMGRPDDVSERPVDATGVAVDV